MSSHEISCVGVLRLLHAENLPVPAYQTQGAAGLDICAAGEAEIPSGEWRLVPTGFCLELPNGYEAQVRPRSGLALKYGVTVLNAPGTIDSDYRGEIKILLVNHGVQPFRITRGDRIAQLVIAPVTHVELMEIPHLSESARGAGGFGSTEKKSI